MIRFFISKILTSLSLGSLFLVGCSLTEDSTPNPTLVSGTASPTAVPVNTPTVREATTVPKPTNVPSILTICSNNEPESLFLYEAGTQADHNILEAIYDGPIDTNSFNYQPVILDKLPNLADGDARIEPVQVNEGDLVLNNAGEIVRLSSGESIRPFGCNQARCAVIWDGETIEMAQLSADFTLVEGTKWSDGQPLTADDSVFSYKIASDCLGPLENQCGGLGLVHTGYVSVERTANYTALNQRTTRWVGLPGFLDPNYPANFFHPLPVHQLKDLSFVEIFQAKETRLQPMGWGPYIIDEWIQGDYIRMYKNPYYFRSNEGLPKFEYLVYRFIDENSNAAIADVLAGDCDIIDQTISLYDQIELLLVLQDADLISPNIVTNTIWEHVDFSIQHADYDDGYQPGRDRPDFFGDVRMRQAMVLCMDRYKVVEEVLFGRSKVMDSYLPPEHPLYNPGVEHYSFNPIAGSDLLKEMGWNDHDNDPTTPRIARDVPNVPEGTSLSLTYTTTTSSQRQKISQILATSLAQCGIQMKLEYMSPSEFYADPPTGDLLSRHFDLAESAWSTGFTPSCDLYTAENIPGDPLEMDSEGKPRFLHGWQGQNVIGYRNPEYDRACQFAEATLPGQPGYVENYHKVQEILAIDLPFIPLYQHIEVSAARPDLCGYWLDPTARGDSWNIELFDYGEGCK